MWHPLGNHAWAAYGAPAMEHPPSVPSSRYGQGARKRRVASFLLAVLAEALLVLVLLTLAPRVDKRSAPSIPKSFGLLPDRTEQAATTTRAPKKADAKAAAKQHAAAPKAITPTPSRDTPVSAPTPKVTMPNILPIDLASSDIGKIKSARSPADTGDGNAAGGGDSASAYGPGAGPGGERLYDADWYPHPPSNAELNGYLPHGAPPGGWALIACRTIESYRVDNCRSLGESPVGSGLARAMREAAWQFRVRPPRVGGKALVGAWVRIRISFTERGAPEAQDQP